MSRLNRLTERLREMHTIRRNTTPLSVAIGLAQEAADELDRLQARVAELEADAERWAFYRSKAGPDAPNPFWCLRVTPGEVDRQADRERSK